MQELLGKTAFVTGGASGIGLALGRAFAEAGMNVMLADVEVEALASALTELKSFGQRVRGVRCDVSDPDSVDQAAREAQAAFGNVHVVCNNAGVAGGAGLDPIDLGSWRWVLEVNVMGVMHGIRTFLPHFRSHGEGGHFVNTASMAGLQSEGGCNPYVASKYAVVSISEGLAKELAAENIGVSVLCPSFTRTRIGFSGRNRPARFGPAKVASPVILEQLEKGRDPAEIAARTLEAIRENELYVLTHPEWNWELEKRIAAIQEAMRKSALRR